MLKCRVTSSTTRQGVTVGGPTEIARDLMQADWIKLRTTSKDRDHKNLTLSRDPRSYITPDRMDVKDSERGSGTAETTVLPLSSKRITRTHLRRIAEAMTLPADAPSSELRTLIEGRLIAEDRNPLSVQVNLTKEEGRSGVLLKLNDVNGTFLSAESCEEEEPNATPEVREMVSNKSQFSPIPTWSECSSGDGSVDELIQQLGVVQQERQQLRQAVETLQTRVTELDQKVCQLWESNCEQNRQHDLVVESKDAQIEDLRRKVTLLENRLHSVLCPNVQLQCYNVTEPTNVAHMPPVTSVVPSVPLHTAPLYQPVATVAQTNPQTLRRRGTAPPVDQFTGENPSIRFEDWVPGLERAAQWNDWNSNEMVMQLAGHLRGKALVEWDLLRPQDKQDYMSAKEALQARLDSGSKTLAAHDFRHVQQKMQESVSDFITHLERMFQIAYGRDNMSVETREALLHSQLQEGLSYYIMSSPAVAGAQTYKELCLSAKNEEKRQSTLKRRQEYLKGSKPTTAIPVSKPMPQSKQTKVSPTGATPQFKQQGPCYICNKPGHITRNCRQRAQTHESRGFLSSTSIPRKADQKQITSQPTSKVGVPAELLEALDSDSSSESVNRVEVQDQGSQPRCARVFIQGVPVIGIIDSGADISIIGGKLFRQVAAKAKLKKRQLKLPDKTPKTYDGKEFHLDGRMDLEVAFADKVLKTPLYIKMDATDQLLLSEGVCRQLGIIEYHPDVEIWRGGKRNKKVSGSKPRTESHVPTVRIRLLNSVRILPQHAASVQVQLDPCMLPTDTSTVLVEAEPTLHTELGIELLDSLIEPTTDGVASLFMVNSTGFTQTVDQDTEVGFAHCIEITKPTSENADESNLASVFVISAEKSEERIQKLWDILDNPNLPEPESEGLKDLLSSHHQTFSLEEGERGQTDLVEMVINTEGVDPIKQHPRRVPFSVRREVARQVDKMLQEGVISPSESPWSSPVVMVRKKDGTHRFCVDYRKLNSVTKRDQFPLPHIDDLLDQLGKAKYFSTLDLAAGYWQIQVHGEFQEKTAFSTPQGLFEFKVMPFGLTNAPAVFQ